MRSILGICFLRILELLRIDLKIDFLSRRTDDSDF